MTDEVRLKKLMVPKGKIDVVLDTDTFNEVDDQYAIAYMFHSKEKLNPVAIYAAPFLNEKSSSPKDGMEKSYNEIFKLLSMLGEKTNVFKGSEKYLDNEKTAVMSPAALDLIQRAKNYSSDNPLYVVSIAAITNIASALILSPEIADKIVVVWLGGHAHHYKDTNSFNMRQDIAAARVVMQSGVPFVQLPGMGVVSTFTISKPELEYWLEGKNALCDYLSHKTIKEAEVYAKGQAWARVIWDVTAVAWLLNDNEKFMKSRIVPTYIPNYDSTYDFDNTGYPMRYVYHINRNELMTDLIEKLIK